MPNKQSDRQARAMQRQILDTFSRAGRSTRTSLSQSRKGARWKTVRSMSGISATERNIPTAMRISGTALKIKRGAVQPMCMSTAADFFSVIR